MPSSVKLPSYIHLPYVFWNLASYLDLYLWLCYCYPLTHFIPLIPIIIIPLQQSLAPVVLNYSWITICKSCCDCTSLTRVSSAIVNLYIAHKLKLSKHSMTCIILFEDISSSGGSFLFIKEPEYTDGFSCLLFCWTRVVDHIVLDYSAHICSMFSPLPPLLHQMLSSFLIWPSSAKC